ncbi:MAG: hypothetical protein JWP80_2738 [Pseudomonas sp.]|nr:hypothetical protein [Pseudomonas sp.]
MVSGTRQQFVAANQKIAVIKIVQDAAEQVDFFFQYRVGLIGIHRWAAFAFACRLLLERRL